MRIKSILFILLIMLCFLSGCGKNKEKAKEEKTTEQSEVSFDEFYEKTTTQSDDSININTSYSANYEAGIESEASETNAEYEPLPEVMEPLDNNAKCNPRITNLNLMRPIDFDRDKLLSAVLSYMYYEGIQDDTLEEIEVNEIGTEGKNGYKMTLKFKKNDDRVVTVYYYNGSYYNIQTFIDANDVGFDIN